MSSLSFAFDSSLNTTATALLQQITRQAGYEDYLAWLLSLVGITAYVSNGKLWNKPDPFRHRWFERPQESINDTVRAKETRNVMQKLEETGKDLVIFWGSQSGTAEGFAHRLARECYRRFKLDALVADLSDYDSESIALLSPTKYAIFVMSTYGEGDPSDNAAEFWDWIKTSSLSLSELRYAAFGLGNTNYKYYNKVVDVVVAKLDACHAVSLLPVGKADDACNGTEEDFLAWKEHLFAMFRDQLGLREHEQSYEPSLKVVEDTSLDVMDCHMGEPLEQVANKKTTNSSSTVRALSVKQARWLTSTPAKDRNCLHLDLDITDHARLKYKTGDHLAVYPVNPAGEVSRLLSVLDVESRKDIPLLISSTDAANKKTRIPSPTTLSALFTSYLEICAPVSREVARSLIPFAPSESVKSYLCALTADKKSYSSFLSATHITLSRLLEHSLCQSTPAPFQSSTSDTKTDATPMTWSHLPLSFVIEALKPTTPRFYSISSSAMTSPHQVSITVAHSPTPLGSNPGITIPGLTSSYLSSTYITSSTAPLTTVPKLYASIHRSTFKLPLSCTTPLILVGTGTGIAPFRAFIHERAALAQIGREVGPVLFFYGCRNEADHLYREELEAVACKADVNASNTTPHPWLEIVVAYSRRPSPDLSSLPSSSSSSSSSQPETHSISNTNRDRKTNTKAKRDYVQDKMTSPAHRSRLTTLLLDQDAAIFFCGSTRMARDAGEAVMDVIAERKGWGCHNSSDGDGDGDRNENGSGSGKEKGVEKEKYTWRDERRRVGKWKEDVWG